MTTLDNVTYDDIYNKIMLVLVANEGKIYDQYRLYSLILDKFSGNESGFVPPEFKYKFFITLRQLMLKDDNIKVIKENNIYQVIYNAPKDIQPENVKYSPEWINGSELNNFIINNKVDLSYQDPESGNTIYHDVLSENNCDNVKKLLETSTINYNIKNNYNKTPIECIRDVQVATIIINDLNKKLDKFNERLVLLENKNEIADCSVMNFISVKFYHFLDKNWNYIYFVFMLAVLYFMIKLVI
jgi:hypothetical protein